MLSDDAAALFTDAPLGAGVLEDSRRSTQKPSYSKAKKNSTPSSLLGIISATKPCQCQLGWGAFFCESTASATDSSTEKLA